MFLTRPGFAGLCHEAPERHRWRQVRAAALQDLPYLVEQDLQRGVVPDHLVNLQQRQPRAAVRFGDDVHPHERRRLEVHRPSGGAQQLGYRVPAPRIQLDLDDRHRRAAPDHLYRLT